MASNEITAVAKGHAPIITTVTGMGFSISGILTNINLMLQTVVILITILAGYWTYRKSRSESRRIDLETEQMRIDNEAKHLENTAKKLALEAQEIELRLEESTVKLIEKIAYRVNLKK